MYRGIDLNQINIRQGDLLNIQSCAPRQCIRLVECRRRFNPPTTGSVPGSQPLTISPNFRLPRYQRHRSHAASAVAKSDYAQQLMSLFPYPSLGLSFFPNPYLLYATELTNRAPRITMACSWNVRKRTRNGMQIQAN